MQNQHVTPVKTGNKAGALRGREPDIVRMRESGMRWEEIAVAVDASKQGVIDAYKREVARKATPANAGERP